MACKEEQCLLATKTEKEGSNSNKTSKRRRGQTEIGVKMAACCPKSKCGSHTEADLVNLVEQNISKGYLQATRKKTKIQDGRMWHQTAMDVEKNSTPLRSRERQTVYTGHHNPR